MGFNVHYALPSSIDYFTIREKSEINYWKFVRKKFGIFPEHDMF